MTCNIPKLRIFIIIFSLIISFGIVKKASAEIVYVATSSQPYTMNVWWDQSFIPTENNLACSFATRLSNVTNPDYNEYLNIAKIQLYTSLHMNEGELYILKIEKDPADPSESYGYELSYNLFSGDFDYYGDYVFATSSTIYGSSTSWREYVIEPPIMLNSYGYDPDEDKYYEYFLIASSCYAVNYVNNPSFALDTDEFTTYDTMFGWYTFEYPDLQLPSYGTIYTDFEDIWTYRNLKDEINGFSTSSFAMPYKIYADTDPQYQGTTTIDNITFNFDSEWTPQIGYALCPEEEQLCVQDNVTCYYEYSCTIPLTYNENMDNVHVYVTPSTAFAALDEDDSWEEFWTIVYINSIDSVLLLNRSNNRETISVEYSDFNITDTISPTTTYIWYTYHDPLAPTSTKMALTEIFWEQDQTILALMSNQSCVDNGCYDGTVCDNIPDHWGIFGDTLEDMECAFRKAQCFAFCASTSSIAYYGESMKTFKGSFPMNIYNNVINKLTLETSEQTNQSAPLLFYNRDTGQNESIGDLLDDDSFYASPFYDTYDKLRTGVVYLMYASLIIFIVLRISVMAQK